MMTLPDQEPGQNKLQAALEKPAIIAVLMVITVIGAAMGYLDGWYAVVLLAIGAFGIFRAIQKRKG